MAKKLDEVGFRNSLVDSHNSALEKEKCYQLSDGRIHKDHLISYAVQASIVHTLNEIIEAFDKNMKEIE